MSVTINFDISHLLSSADIATEKAVAAVAEQVRDDSNKFAPQTIDASLIGSSLINSDLENGLIVWDTPYAQYLYYGVLMVGENGSAWAKAGEKKKKKDPETPLNFDTSVNPNAGKMWYHRAKDVNFKKWETAFKQAFKENFK